MKEKIWTRTDLEIGKNLQNLLGKKRCTFTQPECWELKMSGVRRTFFFGDCVLICITSTTWGQRGVKKPDATQQTSLELLFLTRLYVLTKYCPPPTFFVLYCQLHKEDFFLFFFKSNPLTPWKADYFGVIAPGWHITNHACLCQRQTLKNGGMEKWKMHRKEPSAPHGAESMSRAKLI